MFRRKLVRTDSTASGSTPLAVDSPKGGDAAGGKGPDSPKSPPGAAPATPKSSRFGWGAKLSGSSVMEVDAGKRAVASDHAKRQCEVAAGPPSPPAGVEDEKLVEVRGASKDGPMNVSPSLSLFVTTWNMDGCGPGAVPDDLRYWLPPGFDMYVIAVQSCKNAKALHEAVHEYLGLDAFHSFKWKELGASAMFILARRLFVKTGVLSPTRLNELVKCEIKSKGLLGTNASGLGCILMQVTFHNTTMAFAAITLDASVDGFDKRAEGLDYCLKNTGIIRSPLTESGMPELQSVQHVFLLGDFGVKQNKKKVAGGSKSTWKGKWSELMYVDDFEKLTARIPEFDLFDELPVHYPPTTRRKIATAPPQGKKSKHPPQQQQQQQQQQLAFTPSVEELFEVDFDVGNLFDAKLVKKEGEPSYQDRILWRTRDEFKHLIDPRESGSLEAVRFATHVPVYSTYRITGVDQTLLKRWQIITGNMPVESASRVDTRMVTGVVESLLSELKVQEAEGLRLEAERAALKEKLLQTQRKCDRCMEPLALEGGDVDLGERGVFHRACFTCEDCGKDLMGDKFVFADGRWLCEESFKKLFTAPCKKCRKPIEGPRVRIGKDKVSYHLDCFTCRECKQSLVNPAGGLVPFNDLDNEPYCEADFERLQPLYCPACRKFVSEKDERAGPGKKFHRACFFCSACGLDMENNNMKIFVSDYKVFCEIDNLKQRLEEKRKAEILKEKEAEEQRAFEESLEQQQKEQEALEKKKALIPQGYDLSTFDVPEDDDLDEDDDD